MMRFTPVLALTAAALLTACAAPLSEPTPAPTAAAQPAGPAAGSPATDIYLLELSERGDLFRFGTPVNATDRAGYDNQPSFTPDGQAVLYTSIREDSQADIYRYDLARRESTRITRTPESEYSPTVMPDGRSISVVRVEADSTQRLWRFDPNGSNPRLILEDVRPVGYHAWGEDTTLALFVLGDPPTLQIAGTRTGISTVMAADIGRSLHRVPGQTAISFVRKIAPDEWWIERLDLRTGEMTRLAPTLPGVEDYAWTPRGTLLMGRESELFRWDAAAEEWRRVADLAAAGVREITRLAVSPRGDRVAVVGRRAAAAQR
ncbi:MAG: PD40 domain-containing protein [Gemmatimonadetes bacterium]|nr:PD40 domain-containing protein [Gemmatimonadota bacterium]